MKEADKEIKIIFTDLDGCPGIVMPRKNFDYVVNEFLMKKNASDYIRFDDFAHYIRQIPNFEGAMHRQGFMTWWSNNSTYRYYWPKCKASIFIDKGRYMDNARISGLTKMEDDVKTMEKLDNIAATYSSGDFDIELAKRQMRALINGSYGILTSIADKHYNLIHIKDVIFNDPATIVFWSDGTKTVCTCSEQDTYDPEKGLALCVMKRVLYNNKGHIFNNAREKWLKKGAKKV